MCKTKDKLEAMTKQLERSTDLIKELMSERDEMAAQLHQIMINLEKSNRLLDKMIARNGGG